jgi:YVTN family beta-propeller protein
MIPERARYSSLIPVTTPFGVAYDSSKGEVFVCNSNSHSVSVISDSTNTLVATITVGDGPNGIAYDSGKNEIFVSNSNSPSISVIRDSDNTVVATIDMGGNAVEGLAYDSGKGEIFVADYNAAAVSVISDQTNSVVKEISLGVYGGDPQNIAYNPTRDEIIVPVQHLIIISDSNNAIVDEASIKGNDLVYDLGRSEIFAVINDGHTASVITGNSGTSPSVNPTTSSSPSTTTSSATPISTTSASSTPNSGSSSFGTIDWVIAIIVIVLILIIIILLWYKHQRKNSSPSETSKKDISRNGPDNESKTNNVVIQKPQQTQTPTQTTPILAPIPPPPPTQQEPTEPQSWRDEKIQQIIQKFQDKGAISPQTAMTAKELELSRIFVRIMERRKEQTKIFVEINGKYYLDQKALEEKKQ